jgi:hypothetical protein
MSVKLKVISGPLLGREFNFTEHNVFLFGRSSDCHCYLPDDPYISRHHFMLEVNPPEVQIRDLGSLNGTAVNHVKYGGRKKEEDQEEAARRATTNVCKVKNGDLITVGETTLKILVEAEKDNEVPGKCFKCGQVIPINQKEELAYIGGTFLCRECRKKLAPAPLPSPEDGLEKSGSKILDDLLNSLPDADGNQQAMLKIPGYQMIGEIGSGGCGKVYLARRCHDGRELALKIMIPRKSGLSDKNIKRFQREMKICMELKHQHIITLEEQGNYHGLFYFTMEHCPGGDLDRLMEKRGKYLSVKEALPLMLQIMDGLVYAHKKGVVHRDLKPGNLLLDQTQKIVKISDFGLSKNFQQAGLSGFTVAGEYAGTFYFMPKEQILDYKYVKPVSDIFSIGATFYNILTGNYVYNIQYGTDPLLAILEGKVIPISKRRNLPKQLVAVIDKAISPEMEDRYQTAIEMKKELEKVTR